MHTQPQPSPAARPNDWRTNAKPTTKANADLVNGAVQFVARGPLDLADTVVEVPLAIILQITAGFLTVATQGRAATVQGL